MAAEERNFRNQYYDKMGFRVVEEKKSLETMLSSDTIDVKKMTAFCLRFSLPIVTRPLVWKVLLTVLPPHRENHEFVYKMRCQQFDQLIGCLRLLGLAEKEEEAPQKREEADACLGATVPPRAGRRVTIAPGSYRSISAWLLFYVAVSVAIVVSETIDFWHGKIVISITKSYEVSRKRKELPNCRSS